MHPVVSARWRLTTSWAAAFFAFAAFPGSVHGQSASDPATQSAPNAQAAMQPLEPELPLTPSEIPGDSEWTRWTSGRYRITPGDVLELKFSFVPELDQTLAVQPDGYVTLREVGDIRVQGRTLPQLRANVREAYEPIVREPVFTIVLKEFETPYFIASGEVTRPGRYELRGATTLTQALAYAGGPTPSARVSEVVLFRRYTPDSIEVKQINIKEMYEKRDLSEDPMLRPGDMILVPKSTLGKLAPIISRVNLGMYLNPLDFVR